mmetsp:Transcript_28752/g.43881  ORF Transcript_28752/g.43881 Transcript_28752/m.43881 type:complete len:597 (+) Transcript_28752:104-1894(+)
MKGVPFLLTRSLIGIFVVWQSYLLLPISSLTTSTSISLPNASSGGDADDSSAWDTLVGNIASCLIQSDLKRDSGFDGSSTGWTSWVEASTAFRLEQCINKLVWEQTEGIWMRWMKSSPRPLTLECSAILKDSVDPHLTKHNLELVGQTREEFLSRMACRIYIMPSGSSLARNLRTAPGGMIYGKLLYGGVSRYRILGGRQPRRAGERTAIFGAGEDSWLQYGGPERSYRAVDMGPCAVMEMILLPKGLQVEEIENDIEMVMNANHQFPLQKNFLFQSEKEDNDNSRSTSGQKSQSQEVVYYKSDFKSVLGGLEPQINAIVRRVLEGRVPRTKDNNELQTLLELGLHPVKGLLLYGPPGCGKTALAREISRQLTENPPKIVSAPELLDRWIGGSEKLVRELFSDAEAELKVCNGDLAKSGLHVIVIDEIDAVFRKRSSSDDSSQVTRASAVNQILTKMDGVNALGNILVIGTTNRKELLDTALLRPGRLEVQVEIPLPHASGRKEILNIHFEALHKRGRLSQPLVSSIDNLAATKLKGFSGADIQGLVRCAGSLALARARTDGSGIDGLIITLEDVLSSIKEIKDSKLGQPKRTFFL